MALIDGIVSYWNFDEASGNLIDQAGAFDGTNAGVSFGAIGIINDAYTYGGGTDRTDVGEPTPLGATDNLTVSGWFKTGNTAGGVHVIIGNPTIAGGKYFVVYMYQKKLSINAVDSSGANIVTSTSNVDDDEWHFFTIVKNGSTNIELFLDGVSQGTNTFGGDGILDRENFWLIGNRRTTGVEPWDGEIDETSVFNVAKDLAFHQALYNSGAGLAYPFTTATLRLIKLAGTFVTKPILTKVAGTFVDKPIKIKVGGTFQ